MIDLKSGDCLDLLKEVPAGSVDMVLLDPPYGITARNRWDSVVPFGPLWGEICRVSKVNAAIVLFGSGMFTADCMKSAPKGLWRYNLVWEKTAPTGFYNAKKMPLRSHEDIMVFYKKPPTYNPQMTHGHERKVSLASHKKNCRVSTDYGSAPATSYDSTDRYPKSVLKFKTDKQTCSLHPTQKPVALLEYLIRTYTNPGETVLDNCMGSGSTGVACVNTGRNFIGMEKDPEIFAVAKERIYGRREVD